MKRFLFAAALAAAVPASAQVAADQDAGIAAASGAMRALAMKAAPAAVDPGPISALIDRLSKEGSQLEMGGGEIANVLDRHAALDASGGFRDIKANLVELPDRADAANGPLIRGLVMRRFFSRLEATSDDWIVDEKTGLGRVDEWRYVVSLDGKLLSVEHAIVPIEPAGPGKLALNAAKGTSVRLSPSDADVQKRWKKFARELLTLGRTSLA